MIGQSLQIIKEINDDFLRDEIEYIAQYYNFQFPGDISMPYHLPHICTINILSDPFTILFATPLYYLPHI